MKTSAEQNLKFEINIGNKGNVDVILAQATTQITREQEEEVWKNNWTEDGRCDTVDTSSIRQ